MKGLIALLCIAFAGTAMGQSAGVEIGGGGGIGSSGDGQVLFNNSNSVDGSPLLTFIGGTLNVADLNIIPDDDNNSILLDDNPGGFDCTTNAPGTGDIRLNADSNAKSGSLFMCLPDAVNYEMPNFQADGSIQFADLESVATRAENKSNRVDPNFAALNAINNGAMNITIDSTTSDVTGMDFNAATVTTVQEVCDVVLPRIVAVGGEFAAVTCEVDGTGNKIIILSGTFGTATSTVSFADSPSSGTDVSGAGLLELDSAEGTILSGLDAGDVYSLKASNGTTVVGSLFRMKDFSADDGELYQALRLKADVLCDGGSCGTFETEIKLGNASTSGGTIIERLEWTNLSQLRVNRGTAASEAYGLLLEDSDGAEAGWFRTKPGLDAGRNIWELPDFGGNTGSEGDYSDGVITRLATAWAPVSDAAASTSALTEAQMIDSVFRSITMATRFDLPIITSANLGMRACFYDDVGAVMTLNPVDATDHITILGVNIGAGDTLVSAGTIGDYICITAIEADTWLATDEYPTGKWSDGGP